MRTRLFLRPNICGNSIPGSTAAMSQQARRVDSVEGGSFIFWEVFFSAGGASL